MTHNIIYITITVIIKRRRIVFVFDTRLRFLLLFPKTYINSGYCCSYSFLHKSLVFSGHGMWMTLFLTTKLANWLAFGLRKNYKCFIWLDSTCYKHFTFTSYHSKILKLAFRNIELSFKPIYQKWTTDNHAVKSESERTQGNSNSRWWPTCFVLGFQTNLTKIMI